MQKSFTAALFVAAMFVIAPARAQPPFPGIIQDYLGAVRKPPCKICHADGITGFGTVTTSFGLYMLKQGVRAYDEDSLRSALFALTLYGNRSDLDRKTPDDAEVLRRGGDPNDLNPIYVIEDPQYGCGGATIAARGRRSSTAGAPFALGVALWFMRRLRTAPTARGCRRRSSSG